MTSGTLNFRDVGGLPVAGGGRVRGGVLFRSACPGRFGPNGRAEVLAAGVRATLDLRQQLEREISSYTLGDGVALLHVPVLGGGPVPRDQLGLYRYMVEGCGDAFGRAVGELARALPDPALVHCAVGKDRTGVLIALVLAAVGVPDRDIVEDYLLSNAGLSISPPLPGEQQSDEDRYQVGLYLTAELIVAVLERARALGGGDVGAYLTARGVTAEELARLRSALVDADA